MDVLLIASRQKKLAEDAMRFLTALGYSVTKISAKAMPAFLRDHRDGGGLMTPWVLIDLRPGGVDLCKLFFRKQPIGLVIHTNSLVTHQAHFASHLGAPVLHTLVPTLNEPALKAILQKHERFMPAQGDVETHPGRH